MPLSRKLVAAYATTVLLFVIGYLLNHVFGIHGVPVEVQAIVPVVAGALAGWAVREVPELEKDAEDFYDAHTTEAERDEADPVVKSVVQDVEDNPEVQALEKKLEDLGVDPATAVWPAERPATEADPPAAP